MLSRRYSSFRSSSSLVSSPREPYATRSSQITLPPKFENQDLKNQLMVVSQQYHQKKSATELELALPDPPTTRSVGPSFQFSPLPSVPLVLLSPGFRETPRSFGYQRPSLSALRKSVNARPPLQREDLVLGPTFTEESEPPLSLAQKLLTFHHHRKTPRRPHTTRFRRTGGGGMQTMRGLAYMSANLSESEMTPRRAPSSPRASVARKVHLEKRKLSDAVQAQSEPEGLLESAPRVRTSHKSFQSARYKRFPRFTVIYRQPEWEEQQQ